MRTSILIAGLLALAPVAAIAQDAATAEVEIRQGQTLRDANMARLGPVNRVLADGSVQIIHNSRFVTIPADSLSVEDGKAKTSLTRKEVSRMR